MKNASLFIRIALIQFLGTIDTDGGRIIGVTKNHRVTRVAGDEGAKRAKLWLNAYPLNKNTTNCTAAFPTISPRCSASCDTSCGVFILLVSNGLSALYKFPDARSRKVAAIIAKGYVLNASLYRITDSPRGLNCPSGSSVVLYHTFAGGGKGRAVPSLHGKQKDGNNKSVRLATAQCDCGIHHDAVEYKKASWARPAPACAIRTLTASLVYLRCVNTANGLYLG